MTDPRTLEQLGGQVDDLAIELERLAALAGTVDRIDKTLAKGGPVEQLAIAVSRHDELIAKLIKKQEADAAAAKSDPTAGPIDWMTIDVPDMAELVLVALDTWVTRVWARFGPIQECWPWHAAVVSELLACRRAHIASLKPSVPPTAQADWHTRYAPVTRKSVDLRLSECNASTGHADGSRFWASHPELLPELARAWASANATGAPISTLPGLTPAGDL